jgi:hypothetical protein
VMTEPSPRAPIRTLIGPTIRASEALSDAIDTASGEPQMLFVPTNWSGRGPISFQVSFDGGITFVDLFDPSGNEVLRAAVAGTAVPLAGSFMSAITWVRVRSGSRAFPVPQPNECVFGLTVV